MPSQNPWPFMPVKSTEMLLTHCDSTVYTGTPDTLLYKLVDAICGTTGAGALVSEIFLARAAGALETIYYTDLDYIFSKVNFLARSPAESYPYNPNVDELTADQWNEIRVKDAWYRSRVKDFFVACGLGTTLDGIRMCVQAALAVDADVFEIWRYIDNFGITQALGRADARNELVVKPHKDSLAPSEVRLIRDMLNKMVTLDTVITVNTQGLAVLTPVPITAAASDSTYFEVQKIVTPTALMSQLPPPELLPMNLLPTEQWMFNPTPTQAPYAAFNMTQEYSYFYLAGGGPSSPIDSVTYGVINSPTPPTIAVYELSGTYNLIGSIAFSTPSNTWFDNLDSSMFQWIPINYPADLYPMDASIATGKTNLINAIKARNGPFILAGFSQGAEVISDVYDEIRNGSLMNRRQDFLGAVAFGNPRREEGDVFPGSPDPGGHGIAGHNLLADPEPLWWEFAIPGDAITVVGDDQTGQDMTTLYELVNENYTGDAGEVYGLLTDPITDGEALLQSILDMYYGFVATTAPHHQYPTYQPLLAKGDVRTCVQIAGDYMVQLAKTPKLKVTPPSYPVCAYEVADTGAVPYVGGTTSPFALELDSRIKYISVPYPAQSLPMNTSVATGVANLITQINRNPGKFVLIGTGQGAMVTSLVYNELVSGSLQHRISDLVGAVTFGNPMRQAGHTIPGGTDPGGHGISSTRLVNTPTLWWDFANPGDLLATSGDDTTGQWQTTLFDAYNNTYTGEISAITSLFTGAPLNISALLSAIEEITNGTSVGDPHHTYDITQPLLDFEGNGDPRTALQLAIAYLNTFATFSTPYVPPPFDPMSTYRSEANYESFVETAQFGPWQTYAIADSPDNYPGGKFGVHPSTAPALNPDGTPYNFPWPSQTAYIQAQIAQIQGQGGQADVVHYRLPVQAPSATKEVYLPEYAIAYSAPTMDSTVSSSITGRRNKTVNQSGSNQFFSRSGAAPAGS